MLTSESLELLESEAIDTAGHEFEPLGDSAVLEPLFSDSSELPQLPDLPEGGRESTTLFDSDCEQSALPKGSGNSSPAGREPQLQHSSTRSR